MLRNFVFSENEYYHVYSRGVDKRFIFRNKSDFLRFIKLLYLCNNSQSIIFRDFKKKPFSKIERGSPHTAIGAYCLMNNHFHLLLKETKEHGIRDFMRKLLTGYSMYFNKKYGRSGPLFQSRFKAQHINNDEHLKYLFAYIHLNPIDIDLEKETPEVIKPLIKQLSEYSYSSYKDYLNKERPEESLILTKKEFPAYFTGKHDFMNYLEDCLQYKTEIKTRKDLI